MRVVQCIAVLLVLSLLGACGASGASLSDNGRTSTHPGQSVGAQPDPTYDPHELNLPREPDTPPPTRTDSVRPTPDPNDPITVTEQGALGPTDNSPDFLVRHSGLIVTGRVVEILPAQWTTPDGQRPANPWKSTSTMGDTIMKPVVVDTDQPPLLNRVGADVSAGQRVVIAAHGGRVGADVVESNLPTYQFTVGEHVLVGLTNRPLKVNGVAPYHTAVGPAWPIALKYVLSDGGEAVPANPHDTPQKAAAFIAGIRQTVQAAP